MHHHSLTPSDTVTPPGMVRRPTILVCLKGGDRDGRRVVYAARLAKRLGGHLVALHVEASVSPGQDSVTAERLAACFRLVERLGGRVACRTGHDVAEEILTFARSIDATDIVIGNPPRQWPAMLFRTVTGRILNGFKGSVHALPSPGRNAAVPVSFPVGLWSFNPGRIAGGLATVAVITGACTLYRDLLDPPNVGMLYLVAVIVITISFGFVASLFASVASTLALDYYFIEPLYSFEVYSRHDVLTLSLTFLSALIITSLVVRTRRQMQFARDRGDMSSALYQFGRKLAGLATQSAVATTSVAQCVELLDVDAVLFQTKAGTLDMIAASTGLTAIADARAAANRLRHGSLQARMLRQTAGREWLTLPLASARGSVGVLVLHRKDQDSALSLHQLRLAEALADLLSVALDRTMLAGELEKARQWQETERLRSALLTSVSHDFRTPLTSITGILGEVRAAGPAQSAEERDGLLATAQEQAQQLSRFVNNLLDMTRMNSGTLEVRREPAFLDDIVEAAARRAQVATKGRTVRAMAAEDLPMVSVDPVLTEQVIFNLIDNAAKYSPTGSLIDIRTFAEGDSVQITVSDCGPGIPEADLERIFEKFYRVRQGDQGPAGTGLGLAICRGFVETQGGRIVARNRADRPGAAFTVSFPALPTKAQEHAPALRPFPPRGGEGEENVHRP